LSGLVFLFEKTSNTVCLNGFWEKVYEDKNEIGFLHGHWDGENALTPPATGYNLRVV
jgi:hypothetical protein